MSIDMELYINTAKWLGRTNDLLKFSKIEEIAKSGKYYVAVWGHYSAGKSKLINNLLGRDILPVKTRETTAALTYIQYGTQEECRLIYSDGTYSTIEMDEVKNIFQNTEADVELQKIDHIEISVACDMLKNGLVLVDTPGVNTLIQRHQDLAAEAVEQSGKIVYVLGNSPSNVDRSFIKMIDECGVDILFVRTKCDRFVEKEESAEEALQTEKDEVEQYLGRECVYIPVSNDKGNEWYGNIDRVREKISDIADFIAVEMEKAIADRLNVYAKTYVEQLEKICEEINAALSDNCEQLNADIDVCNKEIERLDSLRKRSEEKIKEKVERSKISVERDMEDLIDGLVSEFAEAIDEIPFSEKLDENIRSRYDLFINRAIKKMQSLMNRYFDEMVAEEHGIIMEAAEYIALSEAPAYTDVQTENTRFLEVYYSKLLEIKGELEQVRSEKQVVNNAALEMRGAYDDEVYKEELLILDKKLNEIPSGPALRLADKQKMQPSEVFKKIGETADVALLLLPGDVIVKGIKGVVDTTKVAQTMHKMGKVGEVILKAGSATAQNAKVIDRVRDVAYTCNNLLGTRRYSTAKEKQQAEVLVDKAARKMGSAYDNFRAEKQSGNVLDALSVAYWTEKLGACFDTPPKMEVDLLEEEQRNRLRREITAEKERLSQERMRRKRELGLIETKEKELEMLEQEKLLVKKQIEADMAEKEAEMRQKTRRQATGQYKEKYRDYLETNLRAASKMIMDGYYVSANQNIVLYVSGRNTELMNTIQEKKRMLEELIRTKDQGDNVLEKRLEEGQKYLTSIRELM